MMLGYTSRVILAPNDNLTSMRIMTMLIVMMGTKTIVANCPWPARPPARLARICSTRALAAFGDSRLSKMIHPTREHVRNLRIEIVRQVKNVLIRTFFILYQLVDVQMASSPKDRSLKDRSLKARSPKDRSPDNQQDTYLKDYMVLYTHILHIKVKS